HRRRPRRSARSMAAAVSPTRTGKVHDMSQALDSPFGCFNFIHLPLCGVPRQRTRASTSQSLLETHHETWTTSSMISAFRFARWPTDAQAWRLAQHATFRVVVDPGKQRREGPAGQTDKIGV